MSNNKDEESAKASVFKKMLKKLAKFRGKGTQLISLYIPPKADRSSVMGQITEEISQSSNIKSPQTRKNVQGALRKINNYLKVIDFKIPPTGLVVFCGNVSENEGKTDIKLFKVVPVKELRTKRYWCDSAFHLDPLQEMLAPSEVYGLITMDKREATIAVLLGKRYIIVDKLTSQVPGKIRAGGQSAHRFERLREGAEKEFYRKVADRFLHAILKYEGKIKGIIIAGPGATKNYFMEQGQVDSRIKDKVIGTLDVSYTDEFGIQEVVARSEDILRDTAMMKERQVINKFMERIAKDGLATYGVNEVMKALEEGKIETLLVSESIPWLVVKYQCTDCEKVFEKIYRNPDDFKVQDLHCQADCGSNVELLEELEYVEWLIEKAEEYGTEIEVISTETAEGEQFFKGFFGIGALLRYK